MFEHWAAQSPEAKAVVCNGQCLSYGELDARADQLAHKLRQAGVQCETPVGLCVDRSLEMIIGMLGGVGGGRRDKTFNVNVDAAKFQEAAQSTMGAIAELWTHQIGAK